MLLVGYSKPGKSRGFTLVELSVVVLILAVLVLAIMYGQGVLYNAKIRRLITELDEYNQQVMLFHNQYNAYPGDIPSASTLWGTSCAPTLANCNGNGDGYIDFSTTNLLQNESWRAWQHLALAGIGSNKLSGTGTAALSVINGNVPASGVSSNLGWEFRTYTIGSQKYSSLDLYSIATGLKQGITCSDAALIDGKIDDGLPRRGTVLIANTAPSTTCYSTATIPNRYQTGDGTANAGLQVVVVEGTSHPNYE